MSVAYTCDGCGAVSEPQLRSFKPGQWYEQTIAIDRATGLSVQSGMFEPDPPGSIRREVHACSRRCIEAASKKYGSSPLVWPV